MLEMMTRQMQQSDRQMNAITALQEENRTLREAAAAPQNNENVVPRQQATKKLDRPPITGGMEERDWSVLLEHWDRYKTMGGLTAVNVIRNELRACCTQEVNKILFEFVGAARLSTCTEDELLAHIKSVAVKSVHKEVHRMTFDNIRQNDGESITNYVARLRAQAFLCEFTVPCPCTPTVNVSYADEMVAQRLVAGLVNREHMNRVLSEATDLVALEDKIKRLQTLETTEQSTAVLRTSPTVASAAKSEYKKGQQQKKVYSKEDASTEDLIRCRWCGRTSHPNGKSLERIHCPAREKKCFKCKSTGHLSAVCEKSRASVAEEDAAGESVDGLLAADVSASFSFATEDFRLGQSGSRPR